MLGCPWHENTDQDFEEACVAAEISVVLSAEDLDLLKRTLSYDKRPTGSHGRALVRDLPHLRLRKGDRLEPSPMLPDVGNLEALSPPATVTFWRPENSSLVNHRCPLWDTAIGLTAMRCIAIDMLHTFHLGTVLEWVTKFVWHLLQINIFNRPETNAHERNIQSITLLKIRLNTWYAEYDRTHREEDRQITRLSDLTPKMVGAGARGSKMKLKAGEAWGFVLFLMDFAPRFMNALGDQGRLLIHAGDLLVRFMNILRACGPLVSTAVAQELLDCWKQVLRVGAQLDILTPKAHLMVHMILRAPALGSPLSYHTFYDESLNKQLKRVVRLVHQSTFETLGMLKLKEVLARESVRARRRR